MPVETFPIPFKTLLEGGSLSALFQPIVDNRTGAIHGYEALIRGPSDGPLHAPHVLFAVAQQEGLLVQLDRICAQTQLARFAELELPGRLFVNLTPQSLFGTELSPARLSELARAAGLSPDRVVLEITENGPLGDLARLRSVASSYRDQGFAIAIDDLGAGYSGLRQWSELRPEYVKIDRHFVQAVHEDTAKRQFVRSIAEIARTVGSRVVAEGIESDDELRALRGLGIDFVQGYLFAKPKSNPPRFVERERFAQSGVRPFGVSDIVGSITRQSPALAATVPVEEVAELFHGNGSLRTAVVTEHGRPAGIVTRAAIMALYASRYGRDLYGRRAVTSIMKSDFLTVRADTPLHELSERITTESEALPEDDLVATGQNGQFVGTVTLVDLLRAITSLQVKAARYANPLTLLPGNVPINEQIDALLGGGEPFTVAYGDLDNFKPFNDTYGYARGDDVLRFVAAALTEAVGPDDFVGHVGGDDFILVLRSDAWQSQCRSALDQFAREVPVFYDPEHREAGGITATDRRGNPCFYPFLSLRRSAPAWRAGRPAGPHARTLTLGLKRAAGTSSQKKPGAKAGAKEGSGRRSVAPGQARPGPPPKLAGPRDGDATAG